MLDGSVLSWNCRGAGSREFLREIKDVMKEHRPSIVVLLDPHVSGVTADLVCEKLRLKKWVRSEAFGFSGGIWVMWNDGVLELKLKQADRFFLHFEVSMGGGWSWELLALYASPNSSTGRHLWGKLYSIEVSLPWVVVGDFNCVLKDDERSSNTGASTSFQNWVPGCGLIDMGFIGPKYTWSQENDLVTRKTSKLDRDLCYDAWRRTFAKATIRHLNHAYSDHCPILLELG